MIGGPSPLMPRDDRTRAYLAGRRLKGETRLTQRQQLTALFGAVGFFVAVLVLIFVGV
jgi:hypothetical protein